MNHAGIGVPVHPYFGPVYLWHSPKFPMSNVFINSMPAMTVGSMGYFAHVPQVIPAPPTVPNTTYWTRWMTNIAMGVVLMGLTIAANIAIAGIMAMLPKTKSGSAENFIKDVTGIDTTSWTSAWTTIGSSFQGFVQWQTWVKLLMPPLPYPGAQGSCAVGSPNVTVNGGPLAFVAPLVATSCSDIPVVPNAMTLGFTNVMVGVSFADLARGVAVSTAQAGVGAAVEGGLNRAMQGPDDDAEGGSPRCS